MFNWGLLVPYEYRNRYVMLRQLEQIMLQQGYHPEYVRRFIGWLHYKNGNVGAGGLARTEQPNKPGFAPSLRESFHWNGQQYDDGTTGACAVDTVFRDGPDPGDTHDTIPWREVPIQGSAEAVRWGLHANVGSPTGSGVNESWHIQPIEIDGHASWVRAGRPAPRPGYPIPPEHDPYRINPAPEEEPVRINTVRMKNRIEVYDQWDNGTKTWVTAGAMNVKVALGFNKDTDIVELPNTDWMQATGPIVGPIPAGVDAWGVPL
jgi:hypothetical protein